MEIYPHAAQMRDPRVARWSRADETAINIPRKDLMQGSGSKIHRMENKADLCVVNYWMGGCEMLVGG